MSGSIGRLDGRVEMREVTMEVPEVECESFIAPISLDGTVDWSLAKSLGRYKAPDLRVILAHARKEEEKRKRIKRQP